MSAAQELDPMYVPTSTVLCRTEFQITTEASRYDLHAPHHSQLFPAPKAQCNTRRDDSVSNETGKKRKSNVGGETRNVRKESGDRER